VTSTAVAVAEGVAGSPAILLVAILIALAIVEIFFHFLRRVGRRWSDRSVAIAISRRGWWPGRVLLPSAACELVLPISNIPPPMYGIVQHVITLVIIGATAWAIVALSFALEDVAVARFRIDVQDNFRARRVRTRVNVSRRITVVVASVLALAAGLTTFDSVRSLGASLLASAGIAAVIIGIAARPTLSNLIAGLQISFAEPVRIDDVVVVEGEWGRVDEITLNYIVVHTWDERSLVIPVTYFLDRPFQNWTRHSAHLLAAVNVAVDFTIPVETVREQLRMILERSQLWDRRSWNLQVTDIGKDAVELRALMTARDAGTAWDLRCEVREELLKFLQQGLQSGLPRRRIDVMENRIEAYAEQLAHGNHR
jgi:small-conductance mechanosensitive channel